jgi:hypothetical protein
MGFKKGRAARAAAAIMADGPTEDSLHLRHEDTGVVYTASSGSEYRIDVSSMQQLDVETGLRRAVFRKPWKTVYGYGKLPHWEFEAATEGARNYTPPKCVTIALEERWQALHAQQEESAASEQWHRKILDLDDEALISLVDLLDLVDSSASKPHVDLADLAEAASSQDIVRQVLADRVLRAAWPIQEVVRAVRSLMRLGLRPTPAQCRLVAIGLGSLSLLRVLLVEADVDVCGLVLFEATGAASSGKTGPRGVKRSKESLKALHFDVQQSKGCLKALMARGALLGQHAPPSKLLRKLEDDGNALWNQRALDGVTRAHPEIPDVVLERMRAFLQGALV